MKSATRYRATTGASLAFAVTSLALTSAVAVGASTGEISVPGFSALGLGAEARADFAVRGPQNKDAALAANRAAIGAAPMNAAGWLRIAYLRSASTGRLDAASVDAVRRSYSVAPFGPDVTSWRLPFLYGHWDQLPRDLRQEVMAEHLVYGRPIAINDAQLRDPAGKLAAAMMNGSVKSRKAAERIAALEKREKLPLA